MFQLKLFLPLLILPLLVMGQDVEQKFSLYFENDSATLNTQHLQIIEEIKISEDKELLDVHIKGYTNSVGSAEYNFELSNKRAANVTALLREFTIISSQGYGELDSEAAKNRRVDILVHYKKDHVAEPGDIVIEPIIVPEKKPSFSNTLKKGDKITLEGIMFYQDRDVIMDESRDALDKLVVFLKKYPKIKFKLIGHVCCGDPLRPSNDFINVRTGKNNLSEARAQALYNFLRKKGIARNRMRYEGMAFRQPTGVNNTKDRRVEIMITDVE
ncbi:MAG: OmpA family protein [Patiriisocius sp.]|uniref:OmpA family protein n=1 Tax=Patiriisocius sp. TaxID=2822396 RepID=UPI003EF567E8